MSGKRQHFVPRFLQKGFASHRKEKEVFTWVYRKNVEPFNTNIINVGLEGRFYSHEDDNQVDDAITEAESKYNVLVDALRSEEPSALTDSKAIAELLAHLEIRTRHLRESFSSTASKLVEEMLAFIEDEDAYGKFIQKKFREDPSILRDAIARELTAFNLPDSKLDELVTSYLPLFEEILPTLISNNRKSMIEHIRSSMPHILNTAAKSGHIRGLKASLSPAWKLQKYVNFSFQIFDTENVLIPLGDSILIFQVKGKRKFKAFTDKNDDIEAIYLPLSIDKVLVGKVEADVMDFNLLPEVIAKCSLEFFISSVKVEKNERIQEKIGELAYMMSAEEIQTLMQEVMHG